MNYHAKEQQAIDAPSTGERPSARSNRKKGSI